MRNILSRKLSYVEDYINVKLPRRSEISVVCIV